MSNNKTFFYGLIMLYIGMLINAFVIQKLWSWIIVPVFGLSSIGMGAALGLSVILSFLRTKYSNENTENAIEKINRTFVWMVVNACFYLIFGFTTSYLV